MKHMESWKSIEEMQQILCELGKRWIINASVFEGLDQATFFIGMRAKIVQPASSIYLVWDTNTMLNPVVG